MSTPRALAVIGMLAERAGTTVDEALSRLRGYARAHRRQLTSVAEEVVAGTLSPYALEEAGEARVTPEHS